MKRHARLLTAMMLICVIAGCGDDPAKKDATDKGDGKAAAGSGVSYYFGPRIIPGDGSPAMEDMSFIVVNGKFTTVGTRKDVIPPKGADRIELTGRTVTPIFVNLQAQPGMNNGKVYGPKNYTRDSVTADLSRYAYYGVMAVLTAGFVTHRSTSLSNSIGTGPIPFSIQRIASMGRRT